MLSRIQHNKRSARDNEAFPMDVDNAFGHAPDSLDLDNTVSQLELAASRRQSTPERSDRVPCSVDVNHVSMQSSVLAPISRGENPVVDRPQEFRAHRHLCVKADVDVENCDASDNSQSTSDSDFDILPASCGVARSDPVSSLVRFSDDSAHANSISSSSNRAQAACIENLVGPSYQSPSFTISPSGQPAPAIGRGISERPESTMGPLINFSLVKKDFQNVPETESEPNTFAETGSAGIFKKVVEGSSVSSVSKDHEKTSGAHICNILEPSFTESEPTKSLSTSANTFCGERTALSSNKGICKAVYDDDKFGERRPAPDNSQRTSKKRPPSVNQGSDLGSTMPADPPTKPVTAGFTEVSPVKKFRTFEHQANGFGDAVNDDDFSARLIEAMPTRPEPTSFKMHSTCCTSSPPSLEIFRPAEESGFINNPDLMDPVLRKHVWLSTTFTGQEDWTLGRGRRYENWVNVSQNDRDIRPVRIFGGIVYCKDAVKQTAWTAAIYGQNTVRFYVCCQLRRPDGEPNSAAQYVELRHLCPAYIHRIVDRSRETVLKDSKMIATLFTRYVHTQCIPLADREGLKDEHMFRVTWNIVGYEGCRSTAKESEKVLAELIRERRLVSREEEQKYKNRVNGIKTNCILGPTITSLLFTDGCNKELWDDGRCEEAVAAANKLNWPQTDRLVNHLRHKSDHRRDLMMHVKSIRKAIDKIISPSVNSPQPRTWLTTLRVVTNGAAGPTFAEESPPKEMDSWASFPSPDLFVSSPCEADGRVASGTSIKPIGGVSRAETPQIVGETYCEPTPKPNSRSLQLQNTSTNRVEQSPYSSKLIEARRGLTMQKTRSAGSSNGLDSPSSPSDPTGKVQKSPVKCSQTNSIKGKGRGDNITKTTSSTVRRAKRKEPSTVDLEVRNNESNCKRAKGTVEEDISSVLIKVLASEGKVQLLREPELEKERQIMFQAWRYVRLMRDVYKESQKEISSLLVNTWFKIGVEMAMQDDP